MFNLNGVLKFNQAMHLWFNFLLGHRHIFFLLHRYSLQLVSYTPMLLLVALYFIVPESSRWLIAQGKNEEAKENLSRRASFNK